MNTLSTLPEFILMKPFWTSDSLMESDSFYFLFISCSFETRRVANLDVPKGVVYGSVSIPGEEGQALLEAAVSKLLQTFAGSGDEPAVLWTLRYTQLGLSCEKDSDASICSSARSDRIVYFPPPSLDLAFDDRMIDAVKAAWKTVMGDEARDEDFMTFEDRGVSLDDE